ncbi:host-nuclease inhibitor Gam family protein [Paenibacillus sp. EKM202P]|uniref:host-nuclease inhibitor Gam family protein n=1 Tax=unclassified Paenibacillus TaxID=185978 RepID=UPI0013ED3EB8|nr:MULTISPECIES: host-nuclease inhibitor Gam family protein [unclassified Paenibacillus]KAF6565356.1 host-nuclease inhibitor Gam family protein [Paenibacillus sp. EKM202P]KAF6569319.1 host-nuclease inhibitor Gam family protein [Paenibacillus sp. EKM207P]
MEAINYNDEINNIIEDQDDTYQIKQDESWRITSMDLAVWADNMIHDKEVKIASIEKVVNNNIQALEAKIEKLKQWKEESTKKDSDDISFFKEHLHLWHKKTIEEEKSRNEELTANGKKAKPLSNTIKLPYHNLTAKKQRPLITINGKDTTKAKTDEDFIRYVKENNPEYIKVIEEVQWGDYKDTLKMTEYNGKLVYVDDSGVPIDFIQLTQRPEEYNWKVKE